MTEHKQDKPCIDSGSGPDEFSLHGKTGTSLGHRPLPPVMNLYTNYSRLRTALSTLKLCGETQNDFLYLVELHFGYTSRGPLKSGRGYYLRNGTSIKDPVLAATGDETGGPFPATLVSSETSVLLPPLDTSKSQDLITEVMHTSAKQGQGMCSRFAVEVGVKGRQREEFEWRKGEKGDGEKGPRFTLFRLGSASSSLTQPLGGSGEIVAELTFTSAWSMKHIARLELKGAGTTGELGERWTLMVVTTALGLYWLRQHGKTRK